jgi:hypothetical protein
MMSALLLSKHTVTEGLYFLSVTKLFGLGFVPDVTAASNWLKGGREELPVHANAAIHVDADNCQGCADPESRSPLAG